LVQSSSSRSLSCWGGLFPDTIATLCGCVNLPRAPLASSIGRERQIELDGDGLVVGAMPERG
jgi:hypothetical protein